MTGRPATDGQERWPEVELRHPDEVMVLERMGSFFPTRLSFMRSLIRAIAAEGQPVERTRWELDDRGFGSAVYGIEFGGHRYSLVAFSTPLAPEERTDRVIARAWDSSFVLFDADPTPADLTRLGAAAPHQEAARFGPSDLILSRANRSVRLFDHVVDRLASGRQPERDLVRSIGYLMRTTAVYGNGKFGIADRRRFSDRPFMADPFRAEMLTVWLIREFTADLVEHIAARRSPTSAVGLDPAIRRHLGIGNATGLGMAPFLVSHPILLHNWMVARETALARVRAVVTTDAPTRDRFLALIDRVTDHLDQWRVDDERQLRRIEVLRDEWSAVAGHATDAWLAEPEPWDRLVRLVDDRSFECQELMVAAVLEPHGELVDGLTSCMASDLEPTLQPEMSQAELRRLIESDWRWALAIDFDDRAQTERFWYVSEDSLEPRLGLRYEEPGAELERPLDVARAVTKLHADLDRPRSPTADAETVAELLLAEPRHRYAVRRVQTLARFPYAEIRANLIGADCLPIDMLRAKLSLFGASKFDPKSDLWTRVTLYQGAPTAADLDRHHRRLGPDPDDWWLPVLESR